MKDELTFLPFLRRLAKMVEVAESLTPEQLYEQGLREIRTPHGTLRYWENTIMIDQFILENCHWCNHKPVAYRRTTEWSGCKERQDKIKCQCCGMNTGWHATPEEAVSCWNGPKDAFWRKHK